MRSVLPEPDWGFLEYADQLEKQWKEDLRSQLPKTEYEWLEVFPEARKVLRSKIKEWEEVAENARLSVREALQIIETKALPVDQSFWRAVLKYTFPPVRELAIANRNIKRLKWLLPTKRKRNGAAAWKEDLERARQKDLVAVVESYGIHLRKTGRTFSSRCPLHSERTASFHIYPPSRFVCFGCGEKGDVITFVRKMGSLSFKEAVYKLQTL